MPTTQLLDDPQHFAELFRTIGSSDSVELKLTVPDSHRRSTTGALDLDLINGEIRQVVFFDTPELTLNDAGLVVRARRIQGGAGDTVMKLRPVVPDQIPEKLRSSGKVSVEVDTMPGGFVCSASMKGKTTAKDVWRVLHGTDKKSGLFSKSQKEFFHAHAPDGLKIRDLEIMGPINILKLKFEPADFAHKMVAEIWFYPDGSRLLELSTKAEPAMAFQVAAEARAFLAGRGIDIDGEQQTKTKTALQFFTSKTP